MNIYVGNLASEVTEDDLREAFEAFGQVSSVSVVRDRSSGVSRGFSFVEMPARPEGQAAIEALNRQQLQGRTLDINESRPRDGHRGGGRSSGGGRKRGGGHRGGGRRSW